MAKENRVFTQNTHIQMKEKPNNIICRKMGGPEDHDKQNKPDSERQMSHAESRF
jgi:hypothetical protein